MTAGTINPHRTHGGSFHDVIVVGARVAGASTALLLARMGLDVLLVDRGRHRTDTLSTHALMRGGVLQLHRWGVLDRVIAGGTPAIRQATFHCNDEVSAVTVTPAHGCDALYAPRRTLLDATLVDAAAEAGAEVCFGVTIDDLQRDSDGRVTGIVGHEAHGAPFCARATIVIGADGTGSTVASLTGARTMRSARTTGAYVYGYWSDVEVDGYEWVFRSDADGVGVGASTGVIPTNDGLVCVFTGAAADHGDALVRGGRDGYAAALRRGSVEVAERVLAGTPVERLRVFPGRPGHMRQAWGPGWALVGDAGYWKDPLSAHGITDALRDAELLARAIATAVRDGADERESLDTYATTRDRLSHALFEVSEELATHTWTREQLPLALRRLSASMTDEVAELAGLGSLPTRTLHPTCL